MLSPIVSYSDRFHNDLDGAVLSTMSRSARRGPWLPEEDQALLQLVRSQGANNWVRISQQIQHRSPKQCRERYHQNLKPSLKHDPISAHEGEMIERLVQEMGKRWAEIARRLGNRSDNAVKNWWNGSVNRRRRNPSQHPATTGFKQVGSRLQPVPFTLPPEPSYHQRTQSIHEPHQSTASTSQRSRGEFTRPHRPSQLQVSPPSTSNYTTGGETSTSTAHHGHALRSASLTYPHPGQSMALATYENEQSKVYTQGQRPELPPIRAVSGHVERRNLGMERSPISPALSDTSQRHTPSLVPDDQSSYSVSPGLTATPCLSGTLPSSYAAWPDHHTSFLKNQKTEPYAHVYSSNAYAGFDRKASADSQPRRLHVHSSQQSTSEEKSKDVRMNVSTLLQ